MLSFTTYAIALLCMIQFWCWGPYGFNRIGLPRKSRLCYLQFSEPRNMLMTLDQ